MTTHGISGLSRVPRAPVPTNSAAVTTAGDTLELQAGFRANPPPPPERSWIPWRNLSEQASEILARSHKLAEDFNKTQDPLLKHEKLNLYIRNLGRLITEPKLGRELQGQLQAELARAKSENQSLRSRLSKNSSDSLAINYRRELPGRIKQEIVRLKAKGAPKDLFNQAVSALRNQEPAQMHETFDQTVADLKAARASGWSETEYNFSETDYAQKKATLEQIRSESDSFAWESLQHMLPEVGTNEADLQIKLTVFENRIKLRKTILEEKSRIQKEMQAHLNNPSELYDHQTKKIHLEIKLNNLRTRWLAQQKKDGTSDEKLPILEAEQRLLNTRYQKSLFELQKLTSDENTRRKVSKTVQTIGQRVYEFINPQDLETDFVEISKNRQLALNGMSSVKEAALASLPGLGSLYSAGPQLAQLLNSTEEQARQLPIFSKLQSVVDNLFGAHSWLMRHPLEVQRFAGNIQQTINILTGKGFLIAGLSQATAENYIKDVLLGSHQHIPAANDQGIMPPELIALLTMSEWLPTAAGTWNTTVAALTKSAAAYSILPAPLALAVGAASAAWDVYTTRKASNIIRRNNLEKIANAGLVAYAHDGTPFEQADAGLQYMLMRDAVQDAGTLHRDLFEVGASGTIKRVFQRLADWWNVSSFKEKAYRFATQVVAPVVVGAGFAGAIILTGGIAAGPIAAAAAAGGSAMLASAWRAITFNRHAPIAGMEKTRTTMAKMEFQRRFSETGEKLGRLLQIRETELDLAEAGS